MLPGKLVSKTFLVDLRIRYVKEIGVESWKISLEYILPKTIRLFEQLDFSTTLIQTTYGSYAQNFCRRRNKLSHASLCTRHLIHSYIIFNLCKKHVSQDEPTTPTPEHCFFFCFCIQNIIHTPIYISPSRLA